MLSGISFCHVAGISRVFHSRVDLDRAVHTSILPASPPLSLEISRRRGSHGGAQLGEVALAPDHGGADPPPGAARRGPGPQTWQGEVPSATGAAARWPRRGCSPARARLDGPSAHGGSTGASGCSPGAAALGRGGLQRRRGYNVERT